MKRKDFYWSIVVGLGTFLLVFGLTTIAGAQTFSQQQLKRFSNSATVCSLDTDTRMADTTQWFRPGAVSAIFFALRDSVGPDTVRMRQECGTRWSSAVTFAAPCGDAVAVGIAAGHHYLPLPSSLTGYMRLIFYATESDSISRCKIDSLMLINRSLQ